jgi:hypothetical protein
MATSGRAESEPRGERAARRVDLEVRGRASVEPGGGGFASRGEDSALFPAVGEGERLSPVAGGGRKSLGPLSAFGGGGGEEPAASFGHAGRGGRDGGMRAERVGEARPTPIIRLADGTLPDVVEESPPPAYLGSNPRATLSAGQLLRNRAAGLLQAPKRVLEGEPPPP